MSSSSRGPRSRLVEATVVEPEQDARFLRQQVRAIADHLADLGDRRGDLVPGRFPPLRVPHGDAGDPGHHEPVGVGSAVLSSHQARIEHEDDKRKRAFPISCICPGLYRTQRQNVSTRSYRLAHGRRGNCLLRRA